MFHIKARDLLTLLCLITLCTATDASCAEERQRLIGGFFKHRFGLTLPQCEDDGSYSPVQCTMAGSTQLCRCVAPDGTALTSYTDVTPIYCNCARDKYLSARGDQDFSCDESTGNYFPILCSDDKNCYCVDSKGKEIKGSSVRFDDKGTPVCE